MGVHDGHRQRLRQRYLQEGLDSFHEINVLELLLFFGIPRRDTNDLAHALLTRFGSLAGVLEASYQELCQVKGMTENAAVLLRLLPDINRLYQVSRNQVKLIRSTEDAGAFLMPFFSARQSEMVYLLCLDAKGKILDCRELFEGSNNAASVSVRRVMEVALSTNATAVVLAHNHPGGLAVPSEEDELTTYQVWEALNTVGVTMLDHIIVADGDYVSLADSGLFRRFGRR